MFAQVNLSGDLLVTQRCFTHDFYDQLGKSNSIEPGQAPIYIGIQESGTYEATKGHTLLRFDHEESFAVSLSLMIPVTIKLNDSVSSKLTGLNFGFPIFGYDFFPKQKSVDIILMLGANTGRLRIYGNNLVRSRNPYFSPKLCFMPRFSIKRFTFLLLAEYSHDITSGKWKHMKFGTENKITPNSFYQSCYSFSIGLGYKLNPGK